MISFEHVVILVAIGAAGGFLSGLLGVGGGIIFVPALFFMFSAMQESSLAMHMAVGTSMALVLTTSASSAFWHGKKSAVDKALVRRWAVALVPGVVLGSFFASSVDGSILKKVFAAVMMLVAVYMGLAPEKPETHSPHRVSVPLQLLVAGGIGFLAAFLGVGGAILTVPFMAYIGVPMRTAVGTGSALATVIALPGTMGYILSGWMAGAALPPWSLGYINVAALALVVPVSMLLSPVGVNVSHRLPRSLLRRIFAGVLLVVLVRMLI